MVGARRLFSAAAVALLRGSLGADGLIRAALLEVDLARLELGRLRTLGRDATKAIGPRRHAEHRRKKIV